MFSYLQIRNPRERLLVGLADLAIAPAGWTSGHASGPIRRMLLLRLERIGDLLMTLDAIGLARQLAPGAEIDLAVGSWNADLARLIPGLRQLDLVDVPWLAREGTEWSWSNLILHTREWRDRHYDLVLNFEPDIRSTFLAWLSGAPKRFGYGTAGGGAFLTTALPYEPARHVRDNARVLVERALGAEAAARPACRARRAPQAARPASGRARRWGGGGRSGCSRDRAGSARRAGRRRAGRDRAPGRGRVRRFRWRRGRCARRSAR
jgi:hypothetical protein